MSFATGLVTAPTTPVRSSRPPSPIRSRTRPRRPIGVELQSSDAEH